MNNDIGAIFNPDSFGNRSNHVPSRVQPDTLYNFVTKLDFIIDSLQHKRIAPRYFVEDIKYLKIPRKKAAIPMTCFCDINLNKIEYHMEFYGSYGLAFNKSWCMERGVQPVQYLNRSSDLQKEFHRAFISSYNNSNKDLAKSKPYNSLLNYLTNQMIYYKPYQGKFPILDKDGNRSNTIRKMKCFADECEWRYIPDLSKLGMSQIITDEDVIANWLKTYNDMLSNEESVTLNFEYADLKYVVIKDINDFRKLIDIITEWESNRLISNKELYDLLPKIIIWEEIKGDF